MKFKQFATILRVCALAALFVVATQASAFALPIVNFSTTGTFSGSGTNVINFAGGGTATLTFNGTANSLDAPSNTNFGDMLLTTTGDFSGVANTGFTLNISQTAPSVGGGALIATLSGTLAKINSTDFVLSFTTTSVVIGDVTYTVQPSYFIVPPSSGTGGGAVAGDTTIQGRITATNPVPEPASMLLLGTGLLAAFRARRKVGIQ